MEPEDLLNYENEPEIKQKIGSEKIYYSDKIVKRKKAFFGKDQERNLINRYFEGHRNEVIKITSISSSCNTIISLSKDKEFIIWEINSGNILLKFENYFTPVCILGTNFGFCCGSFEFLQKLWNILKQKTGITGGSYYAPDSCLKFGKQDSEKIAKYMYKNNPELFLLRKKAKFEKYFNLGGNI